MAVQNTIGMSLCAGTPAGLGLFNGFGAVPAEYDGDHCVGPSGFDISEYSNACLHASPAGLFARPFPQDQRGPLFHGLAEYLGIGRDSRVSAGGATPKLPERLTKGHMVFDVLAQIPYFPILDPYEVQRQTLILHRLIDEELGLEQRRASFDVFLRNIIETELRRGKGEWELPLNAKHLIMASEKFALLSRGLRDVRDVWVPYLDDLDQRGSESDIVNFVDKILRERFGAGFPKDVRIRNVTGYKNPLGYIIMRYDPLGNVVYLDDLGIVFPHAVLEEGLHSVAAGFPSRVLNEGYAGHIVNAIISSKVFWGVRVGDDEEDVYAREKAVARLVKTAAGEAAMAISYFTGDYGFFVNALGPNGGIVSSLLNALDDFYVGRTGEYSIDERTTAAHIIGGRFSVGRLLIIATVMKLQYQSQNLTVSLSNGERRVVDEVIEGLMGRLDTLQGENSGLSWREFLPELRRLWRGSPNRLVRNAAGSIMAEDDGAMDRGPSIIDGVRQPMIEGEAIPFGELNEERVLALAGEFDGMLYQKMTDIGWRYMRGDAPDVLAGEINRDAAKDGPMERSLRALQKAFHWVRRLRGEPRWGTQALHPLRTRLKVYSGMASALTEWRGAGARTDKSQDAIKGLFYHMAIIMRPLVVSEGKNLEIDLSDHRLSAEIQRAIAKGAMALEETLMELIWNAAKYGGTYVKVTWDAGTSSIVVENDGPKIPEGKDIFAEGVRAAPDRPDSTGYGLARAMNRACNQDWQLTYSSEPSKTIFRLRLGTGK